MKKKAGIVTIYDVPNFGSVLQAYATSCVLEQIGYEPYFIKYNRFNQWLLSHGGIRKQPLLKRLIWNLGLKRLHRKINNLSNFKKANFRETKQYDGLEALDNESWNDYDLFVVGSDQVWNPRFCHGDSYYMLSFVPDDKWKITIASSFAVSEIPCEHVDKYKKYLSRMNAFSVREENGAKIIKEQLGFDKEIKILLDPTLLLAGEQWNAISEGVKSDEKYLLLYMWDYAFDPEPYFSEVVKYFKTKLNCKVVVLEDSNRHIMLENTKVVNKVDSTVPQFLGLFAKASLVITTSFHGTAFALNFGRPLISIVPGNGDDRQSSLARMLNVSQCAVEMNTPVCNINPYYDVEEEQKKLNEIRQDNLQWIKNHTK